MTKSRVLPGRLPAALAVGALVCGSVRADLTVYNSRELFNAAFPGLAVETFESGTPGNDFDSPLDHATSNAAFAAGSILPGMVFRTSVGPPADLRVRTNRTRTLSTPNGSSQLIISFPSAGVEAAGLDVFQLNVPGSVTATIIGVRGTVLTTIPVFTNPNPGAFLGIRSSLEPIIEIRLNDSALVPAIDNVAVQPFVRSAILDPDAFASLGMLSVTSGSLTIDTDAMTFNGVVLPGVVYDQGPIRQGEIVDFCRELAVFTFERIDIAAGVITLVTGSRPLALLSKSHVVISAPIILVGVGGATGGAGILQGGPRAGEGPGGGGAGQYQPGLNSNGGGGGGGHGGAGGWGGNSPGGAPGAGGSTYGGDGFNLPTHQQGGSGGGGQTHAGGNGGGSLQIGANRTLLIEASLQADASPPEGVGAGGGSGGSLILHAEDISLNASLWAVGSTGAAGSPPPGGGGGGRITLLGYPDVYTLGQSIPSIHVDGGAGGSFLNSTPGMAGSAGVIILGPRDTVVANQSSIVLDGTPQISIAGSLSQFDPTVLVLPQKHLTILAGAQATAVIPAALRPDSHLTLEGGTLIPNTRPPARFTLDNVDLTVARLSEGSGFLAARLILNGGTLTVGYGDAESAYHGQIEGTGKLVKIGRGMFTLENPLHNPTPHTGGTRVSEGTLKVNSASVGSIGEGQLSIADGATLSGRGVVSAPTVVASGGSVMPGDGVGVLSFAKGLTLQANSHLRFELGTSKYDFIRMDGGQFTSQAPIKVTISDAAGLATGQIFTLVFWGALPVATSVDHFVLEQSPVAGTFSLGLDGLRFTVTSVEAPRLMGAISRRQHGSVGQFDIALALAGEPTIEPRQGGASPRVVLTFSANVEAEDGTLNCNQEIVLTNSDCTNAMIVGTEMTIEMSPRAGQCATLKLTGIRRANGGPPLTGDTDIQIRAITGDVNASGVANILDLQAIKNQLNRPITSANFMFDVNTSGTINILDLQATRNSLNRSVICP